MGGQVVHCGSRRTVVGRTAVFPHSDVHVPGAGAGRLTDGRAAREHKHQWQAGSWGMRAEVGICREAVHLPGSFGVGVWTALHGG